MESPAPPEGCSDPSQQRPCPPPLETVSEIVNGSGVSGAVRFSLEEHREDFQDVRLSDDDRNDLAGLFLEFSTKQRCLREFAEEQEAGLFELVGTCQKLGIVPEAALGESRPSITSRCRPSIISQPDLPEANSAAQTPTPSSRRFLEALENLEPLHAKQQPDKQRIPAMSSGKLDGKRHSMLDTIYNKAAAATEESQETSVTGRVLECLANCLQRFETLEEPERTGFLASIVLGRRFMSLTSFVILVNSIFITISTDYEIQNLGKPSSSEVMAVELTLSCFYMVELILKLLVHRLYFFVNTDASFNIFDTMLVIFSAVENYVTVQVALSEGDGDGPSFNLGFLRMLRICKIVKILRIFRTLRFFKELRLMLDCVLGSFMNMIWCAVLIIFFLYMFSLVIVQGVAAFMVDTNNVATKDSIAITMLSYFDTVGSTAITLFQAITGGVDWREPYAALLPTGEILPALFVGFIALVTISVWNIVTGTYMERAMKFAQPDMDTLVMEKQITDYHDSRHLLELFVRHLNLLSGESKVSSEDFHRLIEDADFKAYLQARGIDIKNAQMFFKLLSEMEDGGEVDAISLANACVRMKGMASSIDLQLLSFESRLSVRQHMKALSAIYDKINKVEKTFAEDVKARGRHGFRGTVERLEKISKPSKREMLDDSDPIKL